MMPNRGYDMTPTMYSPDGRIYQVEYALETVKRGTLAIGIMTKEGIVLAVEEKTRALQVEGITQKIFKLMIILELQPQVTFLMQEFRLTMQDIFLKATN